MLKRIAFYRNTGSKRWGKGVIRHRGTCQYLFWLGPIFVAVRNRASARAVKEANT